MLVEINENYRVTSDPRQFILQKRSGVDKKTGEVNWNSVSFHATLESLVQTAVWRDFRGGGTESIESALERVNGLIRDLRREFKPMLNIKANK